MAMLMVPKLLAFLLLLTRPETRRGFGGGLSTLAGLVVETLVSGLIAPVMMIFQSSAVTEILLGRDAGWQVQRRDDGAVSRRETIRNYAVPTLFGVAMAASAYAVSLPLLFWMMPVILGLLLAVPIALMSSSAGTKRPRRLFRTPEETAPPPVLVRANQLADGEHEIGEPAARTSRESGLACGASAQSVRRAAKTARRDRPSPRHRARQDRGRHLL